MTESRQIDPIGRPNFGPPQTPSSLNRAPRDPHHPPPEARDSVEITNPQRAVLELLRERVLHETRVELGVDPQPRRARWVEDPDGDVETFVGRLISAQNQIAARRRGDWPDDRIDQAVSRATRRGVEETLELLGDVEQLDERGWGIVSAVLTELGRKLGVALGG